MDAFRTHVGSELGFQLACPDYRHLDDPRKFSASNTAEQHFCSESVSPLPMFGERFSHE
jgi:hypothetical protein